MIVNSNNANKRSESIGALAWVCAGTMLLGLSLIVSGIILSIATNRWWSISYRWRDVE